MEYRDHDCVIDELLETETLDLIFGDPGFGKTFFAVEIALSVASGTQFHGRDVMQGRVFFIAGEGHNGLAQRRLPHAVESLANQHGTPRLIIIDTLARNFGAGDENNTKDMSEFVVAIDDLKARFPCSAVLIVHLLATLEPKGNWGINGECSAPTLSKYI